MDSAIATFGLTKRYGDLVAVDGLSLQVERGEIYAFLGLNGAGKTTTIRMLLGMIRPTGGSASILGAPVRADTRAVWSEVGYLVERPQAYPELTVRENLEAARRLRMIADRRAVDRVIEDLALTPYADRRAGTLSSGNAQRLGLAKALFHDPKLLILDEPANGLDPSGVVEVRELLRGLARERGVTVFMSSHILGEVARLATRIGIIHEGRLTEEVDAEELERRCRRWLVVDGRDRRAVRAALEAAGFSVDVDAHGFFELTAERATSHPDHVAQLLVGADLPPTKLDVVQEDLETYFLRLVGTKNGPTQTNRADDEEQHPMSSRRRNGGVQ
ncbi:MAG: ABC transporter ATP-binding protein [Dehalococcoidales bacterium]|nr:ABC transporter ATP-binding protein [Dehalococcoidales bacterium]